MGLLSKTSAAEMQIKQNLPPAAEPQIKKSNSLGLLKRSESILNNIHELDFFNFITKYQISYSALFQKSGDYYFIDNSLGFDGSSIITSFSSKSFWDGTILEKNKLLSFYKEDNSISPFYQFLSEELKEKTRIIYILKNEDKILFVCSEKEIKSLDNSNFIDDFNQLSESCNNNYNQSNSESIKVDIHTALDKYILSQNIFSYNYNSFYKSLKNTIHNYLCLYFKYQNIFTSDNSFCITTPSFKGLPQEMLKKHILLNLKEIIGEYTQFITFSF